LQVSAPFMATAWKGSSRVRRLPRGRVCRRARSGLKIRCGSPSRRRYPS
jgi:hypothetical protein